MQEEKKAINLALSAASVGHSVTISRWKCIWVWEAAWLKI